MSSETFTAFFYGTLLHPSILRRVIGHHGTHLQICPALLPHEDYPGVIPYAKSQHFFAGRDLSPEERTVRGTLVSGLTAKDIELLDIFEGDEYSRESVLVHPLGSVTPLSEASLPNSSIIPTTAPPLPPLSSLPQPIPAQTYIWIHPLDEMKPELWEYDEFVRTNSWKWLGRSAAEENYVEVDRRREMNGVIVRREVQPIEVGAV